MRQTGDLVEKLKKKHVVSKLSESNEGHTPILEDHVDNQEDNFNFPEISEANAELVRRGAKLSLEDMESENFTLLTETFNDNTDGPLTSTSYSEKAQNNELTTSNVELFNSFHTNIEELMDSIPIADKNVPSPSEIFKKLCLSKEEDYNGLPPKSDDDTDNFSICKEFNVFL